MKEKGAVCVNVKEWHNYGIDLLRLISMLMIVVHHVLLHGEILQEVNHFRVQYKVAWFLEIAVFCAVNVYGLISGYVGYGRKHRISRVMEMYLKLLFYSILTTVIFAVYRPELITRKIIVDAIFPFSHEIYWYCTSYLCLSFFMPYLDRMMSSLSKKEAQRMLAGSFMLFSILQTLSNRQFTFTNNGYSFLWLTIMYLGGSYIRKYNVGNHTNVGWFLSLYMLNVLFVWIIKMGTEHFYYSYKHEYIESVRIVNYTSPFIIICAVCLVLAFKEMKLYSAFPKLISIFTPVVLDIYLIHDEPLIRANIIKGSFTHFLDLNCLLMAFFVIGAAIVIWAVASIIGRLRLIIFKVLHVEQLCKWCEKCSDRVRDKWPLLPWI